MNFWVVRDTLLGGTAGRKDGLLAQVLQRYPHSLNAGQAFQPVPQFPQL